MGVTVLPEVRDIDPAKFMPSSRSVAFRREVFEQVGGYPEWLDFCEDLVFDFRLSAAAGPFAFAPEAVVYFRPRRSMRAFLKQYYRYARGDGKANLFFRRHLIRYLTYFVALPVVILAFCSPYYHDRFQETFRLRGTKSPTNGTEARDAAQPPAASSGDLQERPA